MPPGFSSQGHDIVRRDGEVWTTPTTQAFSPGGSQVGPCVTWLWTPVAPMVLGKISNFMGKFQVVLLMFIKLGIYVWFLTASGSMSDFMPSFSMFLVNILQLVATRHAFEWHLRQLRGGYHYCGTAGGGELPSGGLPSGSCDAVGRENPGGFEGKPMRNPWESQGNPWVWVLRSRFPRFSELISRMVVLLSSFKGIRALFFLGLYSVKKLFTESMPKKVRELLQSCAYRYDEIFLTSSIPSAHQKKLVACMIKTGLSITSNVCGLFGSVASPKLRVPSSTQFTI